MDRETVVARRLRRYRGSALAVEIERKFLVCGDDWRDLADTGIHIRQGYLCSPVTASVRVRVGGARATLNIKAARLAVSRAEYDYQIPLEDAVELLDTLCGGRWIEKVRYRVPYAGHWWEIDVFHGECSGLVVAEIELQAEDEAFERPPWLGAEVSDDPRYYNVNLIDHPFKGW